MNRGIVVAMKAALNQRGAILGNRTLLLNEQYHALLENDTTIVGNLINQDSNHAIKTARLPIIAGFQPFESPYLPTTNSLVGFGFRQDALVLATRLPGDYSKVFEGVDGGGKTEIVTNPDTGISVMLVMFVDHHLGTASMRIAYMFGVAVGNPLSGQILSELKKTMPLNLQALRISRRPFNHGGEQTGRVSSVPKSASGPFHVCCGPDVSFTVHQP